LQTSGAVETRRLGLGLLARSRGSTKTSAQWPKSPPVFRRWYRRDTLPVPRLLPAAGPISTTSCPRRTF